ncbi:MAG: N,N-dimethylformamidase beta subunit family domain-containing protein [Pseudomonadota bacterium]|nr:N,N-dimethylformamidase beta subunit family domain-containing protein [Pseudomonadota bacterium]
MAASEIPLIGYSDRLSVRPGDTIAFKVSCTSPEPYEAKLVRITCGDPNPAGPGIKENEVPADFTGQYPSRAQNINLGSYAKVAPGSALDGVDQLTFAATIWPTRLKNFDQGVLCRFNSDSGKGVALLVGPQGVEALVGQVDAEPLRVSTGTPLLERNWYRIWVSVNCESRTVSVGHFALNRPGIAKATESAKLDGPSALDTDAPIMIAAIGGKPVEGHYNGKIEAPKVYKAAIDPTQSEDGMASHWDFAQEISTKRIVDAGPLRLHGEVYNAPARAMKGSNWTGAEMRWKHAPETYAAIHFHEDDIEDCEWETDFSFTVPEGLQTGLYGARLRSGENWEVLPFVVCPPKGAQTADVCVLIPTFTYTIYGNQARRDFGDEWPRRAEDWGAFPHNPIKHREFGLSTYNFHTDGSGICNVTWHRPMLNVRPGYFPIYDPHGSGLRHLPADTHLLDWLEAKGISYDLVTDWELHHEGAALLQPYKTVLTCSHPEYHTANTLDALTEYRDTGGKLLYLGGNGFYWRVALHPEKDGVIEVRRGEDGIRAWAAEPGEYYHAYDGEYGGLWRRNGRPPQQLCGVGFSSQGKFQGTHYRRAAGADKPETNWIFEGVPDRIIGDFGLSGGGAAGFELDRADIKLGTPHNTVILATSESPQNHFMLVPEEMLTNDTTISGESHEDLIRADMVYFDCPGGGAVFSVGSITFCGSLSHNNYDNNISRILENVVSRFTS